MRKLIIFTFFLIICSNLFAWQPDSLYLSPNGFTDTIVPGREVSYDERNRIVMEERIATGRDSSFLAKPLFGDDQFRLNVDCEQELSGKKIPLSCKYGLSTILGEEIIPAIYDSLQLGSFVATYKGKEICLFDYQGKILEDGIRGLYTCQGAYQIIDKNSKMYYIADDGKKKKEHHTIHWGNDQILPLNFDYMISPLNKYKDESHFIELDFGRHEWRREGNKNAWIGEIDSEAIYDTLLYYNIPSEAGWDYDIYITEIPAEYKDVQLLNGETEFFSLENRSLDYIRIPYRWVIAKKGKKYGMLDIQNTEQPLLPFVYDKITGFEYHDSFLLEKKGLKCYFPGSKTPRYKVLERFDRNLARFRLPDGRRGWVGIDGKEYIDQ